MKRIYQKFLFWVVMQVASHIDNRYVDETALWDTAQNMAERVNPHGLNDMGYCFEVLSARCRERADDRVAEAGVIAK